MDFPDIDPTQDVLDLNESTQLGDVYDSKSEGELQLEAEDAQQQQQQQQQQPAWGALVRQSDSYEYTLSHRVRDDRKDTYSIGRNAGCDVQVADKRVSSHHCLVYCDYSQARLRIFLEDTSQNGTFVNSSLHRVSNGERLELKTGDEIYLSNPRKMKPEDKASLTFTFKNLRERMLADERPIERAPAAGTRQSSTARHVEDVYIIGDQIGAGMCGTVHVCVEIATRIQRAVKIIDTKKFALNPGLSPKDLREEAEMMRSLDHPNIIKIIDTFETDNIFFIVMELVRGGDLFDRIVERGRYSEEAARQVMRRVLSAVDHLHSNRIIHRDLKPENILLVTNDDDTDIKITDFGLAKRTNQEGLKTFCGTPQYFAPEVLKRKSAVAQSSGSYGTKADVWSLGVVLYILLSGTFPFDEDNLFDQIQHAHFSVCGPEWAHVSDSGKHLVRALMKLRPEERLPVAEALKHPWITGAYFPDSGSRREAIRRYVGSSQEAVVAAAAVPAAVPAAVAGAAGAGAGGKVKRKGTTGNRKPPAAPTPGLALANVEECSRTSDGSAKPLALWSKSMSVKRSQCQNQNQNQNQNFSQSQMQWPLGTAPTGAGAGAATPCASSWGSALMPAPSSVYQFSQHLSQSQPQKQSHNQLLSQAQTHSQTQQQPQSLFRAATSAAAQTPALRSPVDPCMTTSGSVPPSLMSRTFSGQTPSSASAPTAVATAQRRRKKQVQQAHSASVPVASASIGAAATQSASASGMKATLGRKRPPRPPRLPREQRASRLPPSAAGLEDIATYELSDDCIEQYSSSNESIDGDGDGNGDAGLTRKRDKSALSTEKVYSVLSPTPVIAPVIAPSQVIAPAPASAPVPALVSAPPPAPAQAKVASKASGVKRRRVSQTTSTVSASRKAGSLETAWAKEKEKAKAVAAAQENKYNGEQQASI